MMRLLRFAPILLSLLLSSPILAAGDSARGPNGCPPNVGDSYICLTREEAQALKLRLLDEQDQIITLREQAAKLRLAAPTGIRRFVRPWATVGAERLLDDGTYHPYGLAGVDVGRISVWGGFFGDSPAAGVGYRW